MSYKCICGFEVLQKIILSNHHKNCRQYREYLRMISEDPKTVALIQERGSIKGAARELGIDKSALARLMRKKHISIEGRTGNPIPCPCGFTSNDSRLTRGHKISCPTWKEYLKTIANDATSVLEEIRQKGLEPTAKRLGVADATLRSLLGIKSKKDIMRPPVSTTVTTKVVYKDPTSEQVLDAIFKMYGEYHELRTENESLKKQLATLTTANESLVKKHERAEADLKNIREKFNKAFALKIEAEQSRQVLENR